MLKEQYGIADLVKWSPADSFVVFCAGEIVSDLLLVDPEQTMQGKDIGLADVGDVVIRVFQVFNRHI